MPVETVIWPMVRTGDDMLTLDEIRSALNNLNDRLSVIEQRAPVSTDNVGTDVFTPADRAMLQEVGAFFGVHTVVANTVASREAGATEIDPNTGLPPQVVAQRQTFQNVDLPQTGA